MIDAKVHDVYQEFQDDHSRAIGKYGTLLLFEVIEDFAMGGLIAGIAEDAASSANKVRKAATKTLENSGNTVKKSTRVVENVSDGVGDGKTVVKQVEKTVNVVDNYVPNGPVKIGDVHSMKTIKSKTRFGKGNRNTPKTIAKGDVDLNVDKLEIDAGKAKLLENGDILTSSGRIYGRHTENNTIFLRSGSPGTVDVTQAEYDILRNMLNSGGLKDGAQKMYEGYMRSGNPGVTSTTKERLLELFNSIEH